ncbi:MAG TPA: hypothetical protein ENN32_05170, partial [Chloroflexi bacterium]|nr:hypothetical protein [Chloroflexota bacterium]
MSDLPPDLLKELNTVFLAETEERLLRMTNLLTSIQMGALTDEESLDAVETLSREAHSLKGAAGAIGKAEIMQLLQTVEDIFSEIKAGQLHNSKPMIDSLFEAMDIVDDYAGMDMVSDQRWQTSIEQLSSFLNESDEEAFGVLGSLGDYRLNTIEEEQEPSPEISPEPFDAETVKPKSKRVENPNLSTGDFEAKRINSVRINADRLEHLINQTEELLSLQQISNVRKEQIQHLQNQFHQTHRQYQNLRTQIESFNDHLSIHTPAKTGLFAEQIKETVAEVEQGFASLSDSLFHLVNQAKQHERQQKLLIKNVLDEALNTGMLSFNELFRNYPTLMRRLATETGKDFVFTMQGDQIEVDRMILESLNDPMVHLLRNAVDHGMEYPEERAAAGKPPRGEIQLQVHQIDGQTVEIVLSDDGKGLDREKILKTAVDRGLCPPDTYAALSDEMVFDFIFRSGFSTKGIVTAVSGRGLGMAIVKDTLMSIGGKLTIESEWGKGTTFRMQLPISRSIFHGLLLKVGGRPFIIPEDNLKAVIKITNNEIISTGKLKTISYHGKPMQMIDLAGFFGLPNTSQPGKNASLIIIATAFTDRLAIKVDEIVGIQEVVVKSMGSQLKNINGVAAVTILGEGEIVPILRLSDIIHIAKRQSDAAPAIVLSEYIRNPDEDKQKRLLVADDST